MRIHPTPELMEATYELLRLTPPFKSWGLPPGDELSFCVTDHVDRYGHYDADKGGWRIIAVSAKWNRSLYTLQLTIAHEMCHLRQHQLKRMEEKKGGHGPLFHALAMQVCKHHGFDRSRF